MLPEETKQRIEREAANAQNKINIGEYKNSAYYWGYIAGATAEAENSQRLAEDAESWKRAYEEIEKKYKSDQEAWELINEAYQHLKIGFESAEKMADALESVKEDTEVIIEVYPTLAPAKTIINTIDNALQQWRGEK